MSLLESFVNFLERISNGENAVPALLFALLLFVLSQFLLAFFNHKADRRAYQYNRSSKIGEKRFDKESFHIEKVSQGLLLLIDITDRILQNDHYGDNEKKLWYERYEESLGYLGAAAPFVNYIDEKTGRPYCGVSVCSNSIETFPYCGTSLYYIATDIVDRCLIIAAEEGVALKSEYTLQEGDLKRSCSISDLRCLYDQYIYCAQCRLRNCETGTKDTLRDNFKKLRRGWINRAFRGSRDYLLNPCPRESLDERRLETPIHMDEVHPCE